ncbi:substrate binding domain-containing protein [Pseudomonas lalucatii]|nr:substrate binding domain-containing protein [Pseudomonas lalucatii]
MDEARAAMAAPSQQPNGTLRVSCSASFGRQHLSPALAAFLERYPTLKVDLQLSDQIVDLVQDGFDLGIRIAPGVDPGLVARKLADSSRILCAAPSYLARHGTPERPRDLARHRCLVLHEQNTWTLCHANGEKSAVHVSGPLRSNHGESLRDAALSGQGISIQSLWSIHRELADGSLVPVLADYPSTPSRASGRSTPAAACWPPRCAALSTFCWSAGPTRHGSLTVERHRARGDDSPRRQVGLSASAQVPGPLPEAFNTG